MTTPENIHDWLQVSQTIEADVYRLRFTEHHLGNTWIRSIHGGVGAALIETSAEAKTRKQLTDDSRAEQQVRITSSAIDYLRITKDADMFARATIVRISRRVCVVDVVCWQDDEATPVTRGTVTLKIG